MSAEDLAVLQWIEAALAQKDRLLVPMSPAQKQIALAEYKQCRRFTAERCERAG